MKKNNKNLFPITHNNQKINMNKIQNKNNAKINA